MEHSLSIVRILTPSIGYHQSLVPRLVLVLLECLLECFASNDIRKVARGRSVNAPYENTLKISRPAFVEPELEEEGALVRDKKR